MLCVLEVAVSLTFLLIEVSVACSISFEIKLVADRGSFPSAWKPILVLGCPTSRLLLNGVLVLVNDD